MSLFFDIGANRGEASYAALQKGFDKIIALEPAPRIFKELASNFIYSNVVPLKYAVSDTDYSTVQFFEAEEDGLSTLNKDWLSSSEMPYAGKPFRTITATTITLDTLAEIYGEPDLTKIDVEGAEWSVFRGMTKYHGPLCFEWTYETLDQHEEQLAYLKTLGYMEVGPQFIEHHLVPPEKWYPNTIGLKQWVNDNAQEWEKSGWLSSRLRPTADVGMVWLR